MLPGFARSFETRYFRMDQEREQAIAVAQLEMYALRKHVGALGKFLEAGGFENDERDKLRAVDKVAAPEAHRLARQAE